MNYYAVLGTLARVHLTLGTTDDMEKAYDYAIEKEDANLIDSDGNPAGTLQEHTQELLSVFDGLDDLTNTDTDAVSNMATDAMTKTAAYKVLTARLLLKNPGGNSIMDFLKRSQKI